MIDNISRCTSQGDAKVSLAQEISLVDFVRILLLINYFLFIGVV